MSPHLNGFAWHVTEAFCDPLSKCLLEEGDTVHQEALMYESWPPPAGSKTIQITKPKRGTNLSSDKESKNAFESGWLSECELDLMVWQEHGKVSKARYVTTQGRLYSCLWRGDTELLDQNLTPQPAIPQLLADSKKLLRALSKENLQIRREYIPAPLRAKKTIFALATDKTSSITKQKLVKLDATLAAKFDYAVTDIQANEFFSSCDFCPTAYVTLIAFLDDCHEEVALRIKAALYNPDPKAKNQKFSLSAHGVFLTEDVKE
jgi:hypothetical protein